MKKYIIFIVVFVIVAVLWIKYGYLIAGGPLLGR